TTPSQTNPLQKTPPNTAKLPLTRAPHTNTNALLEDCTACAADALMTRHGGPAWNKPDFTALRDSVRADLHDVAADVLAHVEGILTAAQRIDHHLADTTSPLLAPAVTDIRNQL